MSREQQKQILWQVLDGYSKVLKSFPRLSNGLTPDSVKASTEYKSAKANYQRAFSALRAFNAK
jgi:hypothetical protein